MQLFNHDQGHRHGPQPGAGTQAVLGRQQQPGVERGVLGLACLDAGNGKSHHFRLSQALANQVVKKGRCGDFILCGLSPPVSPRGKMVSQYTFGLPSRNLFSAILLLFCKGLNFFPDLVMSLLAKSVGVSLRFAFGAALVVAIEFLQYRTALSRE